MSPKVSLDRARVAEFCRKWQISELALFGSVLSDDFRPDSDVDVLVTFAPDTHPSLFDMGVMSAELREMFGREVDLVEKASLRNPFRRRHILSHLEIVHAA